MTRPCVPVRLVVFAKEPIPGIVKTRLIPVLGADGAANLARLMLSQTLQAANKATIALSSHAQIELCAAPDPRHHDWQRVDLPVNCELSEQIQGDLGARMAHAFKQAMAQGEDVLLFGTDAPQLDAERLILAAQALRSHDAVLQPVTDGGYVLLGLKSKLRQRMHALFEDMPWSTDVVAALTARRLSAIGASFRLLPPIHDIDVPDDLIHLPPHWPCPERISG